MAIAILGCGPAGLVAAHAVEQAGEQVTIYSKKRKSQIFGAQYLHAPIPGIDCGKPVRVAYNYEGTLDGYRQKVYGRADVTVSPDDLAEHHQAWDIRRAYAELWDKFESRIADTAIPRNHNFAENYDRVISTIPQDSVCAEPMEHIFQYQTVWAMGDAPERGIECPIPCNDNEVVCNGEPDVGWYRVSRLFGHTTAEWPYREKGKPPPFEGLSKVRKPLYTNCDCHPDVLRAGRYGEWRKGVLVHDVFAKVAETYAPSGRA